MIVGTSSESSASETLGTDLADVITGISVPPEIKKSLWKAVAALIQGSVEWPSAWLSGRASDLRSEAAARSHITSKMADVVADDIASDPELVRRATLTMGKRLLRSQEVRESLATLVVEDIASGAPVSDSNVQIEDDWLFAFSRIAEQFSSDRAKAHFARLLAGEIRQPGSFSLAAVNTLATLSEEQATLFTRFCSLSSEFESSAPDTLHPCVICEPFGAPGMNKLRRFGLDYNGLLTLQEAGLIAHDLNTMRSMLSIQPPLSVGNQWFKWEAIGSSSQQPVRVESKVIIFTSIGRQLRSLVELDRDPTFEEAILAWMLERFNLKAVPIDK